MKMLTTIPFAGFYESWHSQNIDWAEESLTQHSETGEPMFWLGQHATVRWGEVQLKYAKHYVAEMAEKFDVPLTFESLSSPKYYNFETDRIFAEIDLARAYLLFRQVRADGRLDAYARDRFTSRSGFASHYPPDWREWGPFRAWDHNQIGTVLAAFLDSNGEPFRDWESYSCAESLSSNCDLENWIWEAMDRKEAARIGRVLDYLRDRQERLYRALAEQRAARLPFSATPMGGAAC